MSQSDKANWKADDEREPGGARGLALFRRRQDPERVADRLNVPSTKAHRLIARANREGLIRASSSRERSPSASRSRETLKAAYGIEFCEVVPDLDEGPLPLRTLGHRRRALPAQHRSNHSRASDHRHRPRRAPWPRRSTICRAASFRPCSSCPCSAD